MGNIFNLIIIQPLLNILFFVTALIPGHDFGIAVILLTVLVRLALWPLASKQLHSQKALTAIQPEVNKLKKKFEKDPQKFNAAVMELYKEKEVNPFSSCLPTLLQLPVLFGFFYVFREFANADFVKIAEGSGIMAQIYPFVKNLSFVSNFTSSIQAINTTMFGLLDLAKPNIYLGVVAGALQFVQSKMLMPKNQENDAASAMTKNMTYLFPILTVFIAIKLPAALPLYWAVTTAFAVGQQYLVMHRDVDALEKKKK
jgi:YidC/Oxa1 family membrane protein insertase